MVRTIVGWPKGSRITDRTSLQERKHCGRQIKGCQYCNCINFIKILETMSCGHGYWGGEE